MNIHLVDAPGHRKNLNYWYFRFFQELGTFRMCLLCRHKSKFCSLFIFSCLVFLTPLRRCSTKVQMRSSSRMAGTWNIWARFYLLSILTLTAWSYNSICVQPSISHGDTCTRIELRFFTLFYKLIFWTPRTTVWRKDWFKGRISCAPNQIPRLSACKMRSLNQVDLNLTDSDII